MKRVLLFLVFLTSATLGLQAQSSNVVITEEPAIAGLITRYVELNRADNFMDGWRIQVLATTDRQKLDATLQKFQYRYPNIPVDWVHSSPYYRLRAGAFATKLEALRLKNILGQEYSGLYPVKDDKVRPQELLKTY